MESIDEIVASDVGTRWHWLSKSEFPAILLFPYPIQATGTARTSSGSRNPESITSKKAFLEEVFVIIIPTRDPLDPSSKPTKVDQKLPKSQNPSFP